MDPTQRNRTTAYPGRTNPGNGNRGRGSLERSYLERVDLGYANDDQHEFAEESDSLWRIVFAPTIWVFHFLASYILTALVCSARIPQMSVLHLRWYILIITLGSLAGIAYIGWQSWRQWGFGEDQQYVQNLPTHEHRHEFLGHASFLLSVVSFIGVCYVAMPAVFLDSCA